MMAPLPNLPGFRFRWPFRAPRPKPVDRPGADILEKAAQETTAAAQQASKIQGELEAHLRRVQRLEHLNDELAARKLRRAH